MGRGRAKAKQQKVARELKYNVHDTDFTALQRELGAGGAPEHYSATDEDDIGEDDYDDGWAEAR